MPKKEEIKKVYNFVKNCKRCILFKTRNNLVFGEGSLDSKIIFIGEAPGYNEDKQGRPFIGRAGKIFDELLDSINLKRNNVYITNILICRPPKNRKPLKNEINKCKKYLDKKIEIIKPNIFVPMGNIAASYILKKFGIKNDRISKIHGTIYQINYHSKIIKVIPLYHPAIATYNINKRKILFEDIKIIKKALNK